MIKTIKIRHFKSFPKDRDVVIDLSRGNKPITLFYGLNGAGKSAIGQVVDRNGNNRDALPNCNVETTGDGTYRYLVYNQDFVERAFRSIDGFPGIFTIGEPQAEALRRREAIEAELPPMEAELERLVAETETIDARSVQAKTTLTQAIWLSFQALKGTPLREFLHYGNDMAGFAGRVCSTHLTGEQPASIDELTRLRQELGDGQAGARGVIHLDTADLRRLEVDPTWVSPLEGSSDSRLAPLIERLKNQDWVRHGGNYLHAADDQCPFCQQHLPPGFEDELKALFNVTYEQKMAYLQSAARNYEAAVDRFGSALDRVFAQESFAADDAPLQAAARALRVALAKNVAVVRAKAEAPGPAAALQPMQDVWNGLTNALAAVNGRIATHNDRITRRREELSHIETELWQRLAKDATPAITLFAEAETPRQALKEEVFARRRELTKQACALRDELNTLYTGTASIDQAVAAINERLIFLGMDGFSVQKDLHHDQLYQLARPGQEHGEFISLSEGEKTLVTFLYFLELVKGSAESTAAVPLERTIVVVDDPISSLSQNHVYDVATLIAQDLAPRTNQNPNGIRQLIVLTHSLFFFHELAHGSYKLYKHMLFKRVVKQNESDVVDMGKDDLGNDYEAFWLVIKDARAAAEKPATLANAMRCVLERFFFFISEEGKYDEALAGLAKENPGFRSFARYLDRGSHAGRTNITDFWDDDVNACLGHFRRIFEQTNHMQHYDRMMGTQPPAM